MAHQESFNMKHKLFRESGLKKALMDACQTMFNGAHLPNNEVKLLDLLGRSNR